MEKLSYHLPVFEGPLDMLLYLISKNKLNIYDIPIAELLRQYLEQIDSMRERDMDIASEFLEMAAHLVYIKSASLLPKHEEAELLRQELSGRLLEYQECRQAAGRLAQQMCFDFYTRASAEVAPDLTYRRSHRPMELLAAYLSAAGRGRRRLPPPAEAFTGIISRKIVSVSSRIIHVLRALWKSHSVEYDALFTSAEGKSELVATFLAVLELIKGKRVRIEESGHKITLNLIDGGGKHWKSKNSRQQ
jgi:segregation and condensation protein A